MSKEIIEFKKEDVDILEKELQHLEQENEEVLKQLEFVRTNKSVIDAERIKFKQALEEIKQMLIIADKTPSGERHFEYMDKALLKAKEVLNEERINVS